MTLNVGQIIHPFWLHQTPTSNHGGPLKWKMWLVKDKRLSLLISLLPDMPRVSSSRPGLKHGRQLCSSLSHKSNPKSVYFLCSIAGSSSSSPNLPNCSSLRESAWVFADYLRSHFSVLCQRPCIAELEATFLSSIEPRAQRSLTCPSAQPFPLLNFLWLPQTFPPSLPLTETKLPISR